MVIMLQVNENTLILEIPKIEHLEKYSIIMNYPVTDKRESWINHLIPTSSGVYFLFNKSELYYIGKSQNIRQRVTTHITPVVMNGRVHVHVPPYEINRVAFLLISDVYSLDAVEMLYIAYYKPKYNFRPYISAYIPIYESISPELDRQLTAHVPMR